jgi:hypothetical protein
MPRFVRKQIYLEASQERRAKRRAKVEGVPEAEVIRRALELGLDRLGTESFQVSRGGRAFFHLVDRLIRKGPVRGGRRWARDELYDRPRR